MAQMIDNLTRYGAAAGFAYDVDDTRLVVLCVAARFEMPPAGRAHDGPLHESDEQLTPPIADLHTGDPATSSLRVPGQAVPRRLAAEVYLHGSACAPRGRRVTQLQTRLRIGECRRDASVVGDRYWMSGITAPRASAPAPFERMPLGYERAFGGTAQTPEGRVVAQEPRNPIGRGMYARPEDALDRPLPNVQKPGEVMAGWSERLTPWGYGPVPPGWQPRLAHAGTYDDRWRESRLPLWPTDIDERFFSAASSGLILDAPLRGEEPVLLEGFDPDGAIGFRLPRVRMLAKSYFGDRAERRVMRLEAVLLETDARKVTLFWRIAVPLGRGRAGHVRSVVRVLETWEGTAR